MEQALMQIGHLPFLISFVWALDYVSNKQFKRAFGLVMTNMLVLPSFFGAGFENTMTIIGAVTLIMLPILFVIYFREIMRAVNEFAQNLAQQFQH